MKYACNRNALAKALIRVLEKDVLIGKFVDMEQCRSAVYHWVFYGNSPKQMSVRKLQDFLRIGYFPAVLDINDQVTMGIEAYSYNEEVTVMSLIRNNRPLIQHVHAPWFFKALYNAEDPEISFKNICRGKAYYNNERFE